MAALRRYGQLVGAMLILGGCATVATRSERLAPSRARASCPTCPVGAPRVRAVLLRDGSSSFIQRRVNGSSSPGPHDRAAANRCPL